MGRDFPGRFGDASENFSSDLSGASYTMRRPRPDPEVIAIWGSMKQVLDKSKDSWEAGRQIPNSGLPDPTEDNDDLGCPDQVRATRSVAEELARLCEIQRLGMGAITAGLAENALGMGRLYGLLEDRIPHRKFTVAAIQDTQQQIGDGFNALCQRLGQFIEARTGRRVKKLELPALGPTPNKFDAESDPGAATLFLQLVKDVLHLEE